MEEIWKETLSGDYLVSNQGRVWSVNRKKFCRAWTPNGYVVTVNGHQWQVSHLVYQVFHGEKPFRLSYIDGNRANVALDNLEKDPRFKRNFLIGD